MSGCRCVIQNVCGVSFIHNEVGSYLLLWFPYLQIRTFGERECRACTIATTRTRNIATINVYFDSPLEAQKGRDGADHSIIMQTQESDLCQIFPCGRNSPGQMIVVQTQFHEFHKIPQCRWNATIQLIVMQTHVSELYQIS